MSVQDHRARVAANLRRSAGALVSLHEALGRAAVGAVRKRAKRLEDAAVVAAQQAVRAPAALAEHAVKRVCTAAITVVRPLAASFVKLSALAAGRAAPVDAYQEALLISTYGPAPEDIPAVLRGDRHVNGVAHPPS